MSIFTFHLLLLIAPTVLCHSLHPSAVTTPQGIYLPNTTLPGIDQFLGIPYAAPPLGPLRFAAPAPYTSGSPHHIINATAYGPGCLQDPAAARANGLSEDCLTLNIFRPSPSHHHNRHHHHPTLLPVLFFIHGGANFAGQPALYSAPRLAQRALATAQPLLVVTLNYRLGALGFPAGALFARAGLPNAGLEDQRAALRWVRDNAARFGGDPARVTVFGQSAGSFDVWMQAARQGREQGERLFRGAIMESGGPGSLALRGIVPVEGDGYMAASLRALGCPAAGEEEEEAAAAAALSCLRGKSAAELTAVWFDASSPLYETLDEFVQEPIGFGVDGVWVDGRDYWDGKVAQIPMIIGNNLNEGSLYGLVPTGLATNETYLTQVVAKNLRTSDLTLAAPVVSTYYNHTAAQNGGGYAADPTAPSSYYIGEAVLGDAVQDIPRRINLGRHSTGADAPSNSNTTTAPATTWGYRWAQKPPLSLFDEAFYGFPPDVPEAAKVRAGVLHAAELGYVFGDVQGWPDATEGDRRVGTLIQGMWISFAYHLDPNFHGIPSVPYWEPYHPESAALFNFEDQGPTAPRMVPDDMRLDSYNAYREAAAKAGLPPLPEIKAQREEESNKTVVWL